MTIKKSIFYCSLFVVSLSASAQSVPQLRSDNIKEVLNAMTLHEKAELCVGTHRKGDKSQGGAYADVVAGVAGATMGIPRLGIPFTLLADGPAGLRIKPTRPYDSKTYYCTHFPIGTCLASSWNYNLVKEVGAAIGDEVHRYGVDVLLGPGVCIMRNPLCGRNFEYYSEDPVLAGNIAAAYINGVQSQGVGTSIKHFAFNNQETVRTGGDSRVSQRAAREIYLKQFEIAIKKAHPWTVMSSYNCINGVQTSESKDLLTTILREEWGYKGIVMTDWGGGRDPIHRGGKKEGMNGLSFWQGNADRPANIWAGNDLIEPGGEDDVKAIEDAVNQGKLDMKYLDDCVLRILEYVVKTPHFKGYKYQNDPDLKAHAIVTRNSAAEGTVLLENKGVLPLSGQIQKVALFGVASYSPIAGGTGSGNVNRAYTVSLVEGMRNLGYKVDGDILGTYDKYLEHFNDSVAKLKKSFWSTPLAVDFVPNETDIAKAAQDNDVAVITLQRLAGEGNDRTAKDFNLSNDELKMMKSITEAFHAQGKKAVVVLNIGDVIETVSWKNIPDAILLPWQCGQEFGNSVALLLSGQLTPSGKLPMTWPMRYEDVASSKNFPSEKTNVEELMKDNPQKLAGIKNVGYTNYDEDIYVGYRYFDSFGKQVSYPFGYGLSYTTFTYGQTKVKDNGKSITISVDVTNNGKREGKEIVELYVTAPKGSVEKPQQELKGFTKTHTLKPGETETVVITIDKQDLASFVTKKSAWVTDAGTYLFNVGASSRDIKGSASLNIKKSMVKVHNVLNPRAKLDILTKK